MYRVRPSPYRIAYTIVPSKSEPPITTLKIDFHTIYGRAVCQQIVTDMARVWLGEPIEYLALYTRDW